MSDIKSSENLIDKCESEREKQYWEGLRRMYTCTPIALLSTPALPADMSAGSCADISCRFPEMAYLGEVLK